MAAERAEDAGPDLNVVVAEEVGEQIEHPAGDRHASLLPGRPEAPAIRVVLGCYCGGTRVVLGWR